LRTNAIAHGSHARKLFGDHVGISSCEVPNPSWVMCPVLTGSLYVSPCFVAGWAINGDRSSWRRITRKCVGCSDKLHDVTPYQRLSARIRLKPRFSHS
ncbi:MAG: hypothetical protein AAF327_24470, partial [Cyanobacteria bacterium P01_A01_bin.37]